MRKILSLITALVLCTTMWGAEVIPAGEYAGTWYRHSISQLDGRATKATSVVVSAEESGKQTITFKGFKCGYQGDVAVDIPITVTTSNGSCTIAKDVEVGHTNATSGKMYIRTYSNYTSSVDPSSMIITLCTRYYYYDTDGETEKNQGTEYEYIQLNPADWTDWVAFPAADKNAATWTFSASNAFKSLIDASCDVTLMSRTAKENANHRQYKVCGFQMKSGSGKKVDLVFDENPSTKNITFGYAGLGFYETTAKQARAKMETGSFDAEKGVFTLNVKYVYANAWKAAVAETIAIKDFEPAPATRTLYLNTGGSKLWNQANAKFSAYYWADGVEGKFTGFLTAIEGNADIFVATIPADIKKVIFVRHANDATKAEWNDNKVWNQTTDLDISEDKDMYTITAWGQETKVCSGEWSKYGATPTPTETKYYAKNNWNNGDWAWLEMTKVEDLYVLDSVVFGGTGININSKEDDTDAKWFALKDMTYVGEDTIQALDTVRFELSISDKDTVLTAIKLGRPAPVARKEFVFVAGEAADSDPTLFAITWGKDGSNETVKLANKADDIYTAEILETVDSVVLVRCATDATEIIWDGEGKNVWNQTANYELCDTMSFGGWTEEGLITLTCEAPQPVETKYYAKNNWDGGEWSWKEMTQLKETFYRLDSVVFGGTGVNINTKEEDTDAFWFDVDNIVILDSDFEIIIRLPTEDTVYMKPPMHVASRHLAAEEQQPFKLQAGDTIMLFFNAADTTLYAGIYGRLAPVARKEFVFVAGEAAEANPAMFAITWGKDGSNETVKMTQKGEEALYTANILETVDSVVLVRCASDATEIIWDGEGKNVWNQTANYELCDTMYFESWVEETNLFAIKCDTPKPVETKYYAKNNWNNGDWTWLEMTKEEDLYVLDSVVFGGTGVNINDKEDDTDALWFAADAITVLEDLVGLVPPDPDPTHRPGFPKDSMPRWAGIVEAPTLLAGDTIKLFFNAADSTLKAFIVGRPAPVARKEFVFVAGEAADSDPALFAITWGKDGSSETVKMEKQKEALYAADILATVDSVVLVRCATGATEIIWDGEGKNIWNQTANYALCDTMYFGEWTEEGLFTLTCGAPKPVETKYYAKNNWNGGEWTWLEMSATNKENIYMLDSVVFGGTGVNINDKEDDTDALWFAADAITVLDGLDGLPGPIPPKPQGRDTIPYAPARMVAPLEAPTLLAGDTIKLFFNAADSTLKAFITGRPEQPQPVEVKYYITGNAALCGEKAWDAQAIEMIDSTHTFEAMAAGEYEMKITNGAWDPEGQSWGSAALSEECSAGVDDKDGNIHFIVETPNNVIVSIANGKVTVTGTFKESSVTAGIKVNVTVPEGTPACFFYGEMSGNSFVEMTKVDETHYTIDFPKATAIGWGYKFVWENGNWATCNADPEGDIKVEPVEGVITVEVKAWATAPGTEYKYTTYTEWQVKYGPAWEWVNMTKQEDGTFTVEAVWGNTGINIASGENPIKQDWYPLDDSALTVEEGVVEGGNVVITLTVVDDETVALKVKKGQEPVEPKFYVTGNAALVGEEKAWQPDAIEMVDYTHTFPMLAAGEYQLKVTDGTWAHAWGYDNLSPTVAVEGLYTDVDGNICFTVYTPNDVTVTFAQGYVVVTGDFKGSATGINNVKAIEGQRFNILGLPVDASYRGFVIENGRTILVR